MGVYDVLDTIALGLLPGGVEPFWRARAVDAPAPLAGALAGGVAAGPMAPRGKRMTMEVRVVPGQPPQPVKITPGGVALYSRDLTAAKRAKRVGSTINRLFPRPRRGGKKK